MPAIERSHVLVLAAGLGRRMGTPKALMQVAGRPWWRHQADRLNALEAGVSWVVSPHVRAEIRAAGGEKLRFIDADPTKPMFCSLLAGLDSLRASPPSMVFVLPVDCPTPGPEVWRLLEDCGGPALPTLRGKGGHPICLPWEFVISTIEPALSTAPAELLRLDALVEPVVRRIEVSDAAVGVNLNTPRDVETWIRHRR